ncbi:MAG: sensor histidine kinase [Acutalibacter sp.]
MNQEKAPHTGLRVTTILVSMVVGIVAIILCCLTVLFMNRYRDSVLQGARTTSIQAVSQVSSTVANYLSDMNIAMDLVEESMTENDFARNELLEAFLSFRPDVVAVTSYDSDGTLLHCWSPGQQLREDFSQNLSFNLEKARSTEGSFLSLPHVESIFIGYYPWVVTLTAPLPQRGEIAWVSLDLSFSSIASHINNVSIGQHGYCFLMDKDGNIVYHPQQRLLYSGLKSENTAKLAAYADGAYTDDTAIYSLTSVAGSDWRVVGVSYMDDLVNQSVREMIQLLLLLAIITLITALFTSWLLSQLLDRPLRRLASAMEHFEASADHFTYHPVGGTREVQELSCSFGHMVMRIQQLMNTVREEEVNLRKTELKALQAQINPHFLYNTLDSIAWMCEQGRNADAVNMVHALAKLFRISISKGHELIPIAKEIEHAESYLQIQKYRYKNRFTYHFHVDSSCLEYLCNKITIQPFLENAINHGLDLMVDEGRIDVSVFPEGDDILFHVEDNGVGMSQEQIDTIMAQGPKEHGGIGIRNVNDRLQIYFGKEYGVKISSQLDMGTCVEIRMPKVKEGNYETK